MFLFEIFVCNDSNVRRKLQNIRKKKITFQHKIGHSCVRLKTVSWTGSPHDGEVLFIFT